MKLWEKNTSSAERVNDFTVGKDLIFDIHLAPYDVQGTLAHTTMLADINLLTIAEKDQIHQVLKRMYQQMLSGEFEMRKGVEDIHSQIEIMLTEELGDVGKKIHSGRSRNDQVLVDLKLFMRSEIYEMACLTKELFECLQNLSEKYRSVLLPGYTHMQVAMPSSFGLWFGAYAESLVDDLIMLRAANDIMNQNPLGSGAGFGSSFPLNRELTTKLLGFESLNYNVVYAMMGRGKAEKSLSFGMASIASTLSKFAMDVCLYMGQDFRFLSFPDELTTGSSIMPHKKNPDVFELIRGKCNRIQALPTDITMMNLNLPTGYHREMQLLKEILFPAIADLKDCLAMTTYMLDHVQVNENAIDQEKYKDLFTVEMVNRLVLEGVPFREAYKQVGKDVQSGTFQPDRKVHHSHAGSIGNLQNEAIALKMKEQWDQFNFLHWQKAITELVQ